MGLALPAPGYVPRLGEKSVLHRAMRENLETFLALAKAASEHGFGVPRFVDSELRGFLRCGILAHGFVRVVCGSCADETLVGFSCKGRAVCPSCTARRAADCAAHLVENVLSQCTSWIASVCCRLALGWCEREVAAISFLLPSDGCVAVNLAPRRRRCRASGHRDVFRNRRGIR